MIATRFWQLHIFVFLFVLQASVLGQSTSCLPGTYTNGSSCTACPIYTYSAVTGATSAGVCVYCLNGYENGLVGASACTKCPVGKSDIRAVSHDYNQMCDDCWFGTYSDTLAYWGGCKSCPYWLGDMDTDYIGATSITECICNTGSSGPNAGPCTRCAAGTYKDTTGDAPCTPCVVGLYSANVVGAVNASVCVNCNAGMYSSVAGASACTSCTAGKYKNTTGTALCTDCSVGYQAATGATVCTLRLNCSTGTHQADIGATACTACISGTYKAAAGTTFCEQCPTMTVSANLIASTSCVCAKGYGIV